MASEGAAAAKGDARRTDAGTASSSFWSFMLPVLGAIGTGIGVLGFVIFFGGFILWTRFDAAGVPADEAVAEVARNDLVVTGAAFLVPAMLAALAAVVFALLLWDLLIGAPRRARVRDAGAAHAAASRRLETLKATFELTQRQAATLERELAAHDATIKELGPAIASVSGDEREKLLERLERAQTERDARGGAYAQLQATLTDLQERQIPQAQSAEAATTLTLAGAADLRRGEKWKVVAVAGLPMLLAQALVIGAGLHGVSPAWAILLFAIAALTLGLAIVVVSNTERFGWYALTVFLGVGVVIAASTYTRTRSNTKVSPVAAIAGAEPVVGYFVAETPDAVYVARPVPQSDGDPFSDPAAMTLERIPKDAVSHLTVGPLATEAVALRRSLQLSLRLCDQALPSTGASGGGSSATHAQAAAGASPKRACDAAAIRELRAMAKQAGA